MEAGRELDALMAKEVMGLDVVGWAVCQMNPECCTPWHGSVCEDDEHPEDPEGRCGLVYLKLPVYVDHCGCEELDKEDEEDWGFEKIERLGHYSSCLEPVPFCSTHILAAWPIAEKLGLMVIPVAVYPDEESWEANLKEKADTWWVAVPSDYDVYLPLESYQVEQGSLEWVEQRIPIYALAETAAHAICLAGLRAVDYHGKEN